MMSGLNTELDPPTIYNVDSNQSNLYKKHKKKRVEQLITKLIHDGDGLLVAGLSTE